MTPPFSRSLRTSSFFESIVCDAIRPCKDGTKDFKAVSALRGARCAENFGASVARSAGTDRGGHGLY